MKLKNEIGVREINNFEECVTYPIHLSLKRVLKENLTLSSSKHTAYFDAEKIKFPLRLRVWKKGDTFRPLGMVGKKKISDLLIDNKVSIVEKEKVFVLESDQKIIWVVGYRSSEHFKINSTTMNKAPIGPNASASHCKDGN